MDRIQFRIKGLTKRRVRHFQRMTRPQGNLPLGLSGKALVLGPLALVVAYALFGSPTVRLGDNGGVRIKANNILVLVDTSPSMNDHLDRKNAALAELRAKGVSSGDQVGIYSSSDRILEKITEELAKRPRVDAIWIVSDFENGSDLGDGRYDQLMRLLRQRRIKLYLSTVEKDPQPDQIKAVYESGGEWGKF